MSDPKLLIAKAFEQNKKDIESNTYKIRRRHIVNSFPESSYLILGAIFTFAKTKPPIRELMGFKRSFFEKFKINVRNLVML